MRLLGVHIEHPSGSERAVNPEARSEVSLTIDRGLRGGRVDRVPLSEAELIRFIAQAASVLAILRGVRV